MSETTSVFVVIYRGMSTNVYATREQAMWWAQDVRGEDHTIVEVPAFVLHAATNSPPKLP